MLTEPGERRPAGDGPERAAPAAVADPISPELVLVAPSEDARLAREGLEEPLPFDGERPPVAARILPIGTPTLARPAKAWPPRVTTRRLIAVVLILAFAALGVALGLVQGRDSGGSAAGTRSEAPTATVPTATAKGTTRTAVRPPQRTSPPAVVPTRSTQPRTTRTTPRTAPSTATKPKAKPPARSQPRTAPAIGFVPTRSWSWPARRGATFYLVRFYRRGRIVYEVWSEKPRIVLPKRFRFAAGKYRWVVIPVTGRLTNPHYRKRLVDSTFVLSAAAAAQANRR